LFSHFIVTSYDAEREEVHPPPPEFDQTSIVPNLGDFSSFGGISIASLEIVKDPEFVGDLDQGIKRRKESHFEFDHKSFGKGISSFYENDQQASYRGYTEDSEPFDLSVDPAMPLEVELSYEPEQEAGTEAETETEEGARWELMGMNEEELVWHRS
jgi:hypothetical protein